MVKKTMFLTMAATLGIFAFSNAPAQAVDTGEGTEDSEFEIQILSTEEGEGPDTPVITSDEEGNVDGDDSDETPDVNVDELIEEAGLTPDNFFYFATRLMEGLQLTFTFDEGEKATLSSEFALKRLAEMGKLPEDSKDKHLEKLTTDYINSVQDVDVFIEKAALQGVELPAGLKENTEKISLFASKILEDSAENISDNISLPAIELTEELDLKLDVMNRLSIEDISEMKGEGFSFEQMDLFSQISELSGMEVSDVFQDFKQNNGFDGLENSIGVYGEDFDLSSYFESGERVNLSEMLQQFERPSLDFSEFGIEDPFGDFDGEGLQGLDSFGGSGQIDDAKWEEMRSKLQSEFSGGSFEDFNFDNFDFGEGNISSIDELRERFENQSLGDFNLEGMDFDSFFNQFNNKLDVQAPETE